MSFPSHSLAEILLFGVAHLDINLEYFAFSHLILPYSRMTLDTISLRNKIMMREQQKKIESERKEENELNMAKGK